MIGKQTFAEIILVFATIMWALTYPFMRVIVSEIEPNMLMVWRGLVSALIFAIFVFLFTKQQYPLSKLLMGGLYMGVLYYLAYVSQAIGLQTIEAGRCAFITSLYIVFVPLMSPLFTQTRPTKHDLISCAIALTGLVCLTNPFSQNKFMIGDLWTLIAALAFAVQIHLLQIYTKKYQSYGAYAFLQAFFIGLLAAISLPFTVQMTGLKWIPSSSFAIYGLVYVVIIATVLTTWLQARFQQNTSAERAALIYVLEPIFGLIFGFMLLHESVSVSSIIGAMLMTLAIMWNFLSRQYYKILGNQV